MNVTFPAFELTLSLHIRDLYVAEFGETSGSWANASQVGSSPCSE